MEDLKEKVIRFEDLVNYSDGSIVSKQILSKTVGNITLFSFDKDQKLSEHTAPFDALVQVIDGKAEIMIDKQIYTLEKGDSIIMPANKPHAVNAIEKYKMILTMIKSD